MGAKDFYRTSLLYLGVIFFIIPFHVFLDFYFIVQSVENRDHEVFYLRVLLVFTRSLQVVHKYFRMSFLNASDNAVYFLLPVLTESIIFLVKQIHFIAKQVAQTSLFKSLNNEWHPPLLNIL